MIHSKFAGTAIFLIVISALALAAQDAPPQTATPAANTPQTAVPAANVPQEATPAASTPQPSTAPPEGETVHVLVGKSIVINVQQPMTRVLSSNPDSVETMATSPTQIVVEGKAAGSSSLILWDQTGRSQVLDVVTDVDIAALRSAIQKSYPKENIDIEADAGRVLLTGTVATPHIVEDLGKMASVYSKDVVNSLIVAPGHQRQILLEVKFAEVDRTKLTQWAANLFSTGAGNTIGTTGTQQFPSFQGGLKISDIFGGGFPHFPYQIQDFTVNNFLNIFLFRNDIHFGTTIQAMQNHNVLQILAEPNLMAVNGEKATFLAGGEFPFPVVQPSQTFTTVTILFKPFGVKLDFTGVIGDDNTIRLHVNPEVSALDFQNALVLQGFTVPAISTRRAETEIELKDGQSFGMAGLLDHRAQDLLSKIPGIGDIPILGQLFRSKSVNKTNSELMIFVTPHIIDPVHMATTPPEVPKMPQPFLDDKKFDKETPDVKPFGSTPPNSGAK